MSEDEENFEMMLQFILKEITVSQVKRSCSYHLRYIESARVRQSFKKLIRGRI